MSDDELLVEARGGLRLVTLNRPEALNALTHGMCLELDRLLAAWESDPAVGAVLLKGAGERAFCAGGDIRKLYDEGRHGGRYPYDFYHDEYRLNARVHHFPKPYIAVLDGIVMGGGVGISMPGPHRIVTENTLFAMPECGIGLFPDVGGSHFLPRLPGRVGLWLGLTGARIKAADCIAAGIGTSHLPAAKLGHLEDALAALSYEPGAPDGVGPAIEVLSEPPEMVPLAAIRDEIDACFDGPDVESVLAALKASPSDWAAKAAAAIERNSPTSLKVAFRQYHEGAKRDFEACMRMEWRMVNRIIAGRDFYEGTRAVVIDKDQKPVWQPPGLGDVSDADVDAYFAPLDGGDLRFDWE
ncbi:enoyl-CoA hydratase/isomerase family protein [Oceanibacterium hippocampi]|uniref:3-hydroxyisobutyryl-CoA hydrolase n=1 Tax=Oceanibacterium hippocampi TaxID=745714 RepID=A0A1Y5SNS5_9PROT|nr:enoyl-CoA hydratase/isomerase family protein [Oceanibacterium hippocampi]SLN44590.1 putative enoyl-CoA hydratase echA8 [Oceanibacterium hippocampi]